MLTFGLQDNTCPLGRTFAQSENREGAQPARCGEPDVEPLAHRNREAARHHWFHIVAIDRN